MARRKTDTTISEAFAKANIQETREGLAELEDRPFRSCIPVYLRSLGKDGNGAKTIIAVAAAYAVPLEGGTSSYGAQVEKTHDGRGWIGIWKPGYGPIIANVTPNQDVEVVAERTQAVGNAAIADGELFKLAENTDAQNKMIETLAGLRAELEELKFSCECMKANNVEVPASMHLVIKNRKKELKSMKKDIIALGSTK